jgi:hypothetical protein
VHWTFRVSNINKKILEVLQYFSNLRSNVTQWKKAYSLFYPELQVDKFSCCKTGKHNLKTQLEMNTRTSLGLNCNTAIQMQIRSSYIIMRQHNSFRISSCSRLNEKRQQDSTSSIPEHVKNFSLYTYSIHQSTALICFEGFNSCIQLSIIT